MGRALLALLWLPGCGDALVGLDDDLGTYFVVSGPLDPGLALDPERTRAAVAWVFVVDGELGSLVEAVVLEPRLQAYAITVEAPPDPAEATASVAPPAALDVAGLSFLVGLPLLYEGRRPTVDPEGLLDWAGGRSDSLAGVIRGNATATTPDHLLLGLGADAGVGRLAAAPEWDPGGPWCRLDGMVAGLTLYRTDGIACGGWRALAAAGERTEFQGIRMAQIP